MDIFEKWYKRISITPKEIGQDVAHELLNSPEITIDVAGYVYVFLSNEETTPVDVYFDDFKVTHVKSPVVQMDDYYPFGLAFNSFSRENSVKQDFKYNGKELQDELSLGWLDYGARMYMADLGRFGVLDPLADVMRRHSPYNYAYDNPMRYIDPDGREPLEHRGADGLTNDQWIEASRPGNNYAAKASHYRKKNLEEEYANLRKKATVEVGELQSLGGVDDENDKEGEGFNLIVNFSSSPLSLRDGSGWKLMNAKSMDKVIETLKEKRVNNLLLIGHANIEHVNFGEGIFSDYAGNITSDESLAKLNAILSKVNLGGNVVFTTCHADVFFGIALQNSIRCDINVFMNSAYCRIGQWESDCAIQFGKGLSLVDGHYRNITQDPNGKARLINISLNANGTFNFKKKKT